MNTKTIRITTFDDGRISLECPTLEDREALALASVLFIKEQDAKGEFIFHSNIFEYTDGSFHDTPENLEG